MCDLKKIIAPRAVALLVLALLLTLVPACTAAIPQPAASAEADAEQSTEDGMGVPVGNASDLYPLTLTDALGRDVTLDARPQAIIPISPSITEILFAIGAGPQVIGRTQNDTYPEAVTQLPSVGGMTARSLNLEVLVDLAPDLVIAGSRNQAELAEQIAQFGIPVFVLAPTSLQEIEAGILSLGTLTGNQASAEELVQALQHEIAAVTAKTADIPEDQRVRVYYEVWNDPLTTTTHATFIGELIELAGGVNIFADLEGAYPNISDEQVIARDPQVIVSPDSNGEEITPASLTIRPGWSSISAIQNETVYVIDGDIISRPGPRVTEALQILARLFYPDQFPE